MNKTAKVLKRNMILKVKVKQMKQGTGCSLFLSPKIYITF